MCAAEQHPSSCFCEDWTPRLCWIPDPQRGFCQHAGPSECANANPTTQVSPVFNRVIVCLGGWLSSSRCSSTKQVKNHPAVVAAQSWHTPDQPGDLTGAVGVGVGSKFLFCSKIWWVHLSLRMVVAPSMMSWSGRMTRRCCWMNRLKGSDVTAVLDYSLTNQCSPLVD